MPVSLGRRQHSQIRPASVCSSLPSECEERGAEEELAL